MNFPDSGSRRCGALVNAAVLGLLLTLSSASAFAYNVSPLIVELSPGGEGAKTNLTIDNPHQYRLILELSAVSRDVAIDGTEIYEPADDKFLIFPPQVIIDPEATQRVQVRYIGPQSDRSTAYRIILSQVPVESSSSETRVDLAYNFRIGVYIVPDGVSFDIDASSVEPTDTGVRLTLENRGKRHAVLLTGTWAAYDADGVSHGVTVTDIPELVKSPLILPGAVRVLNVPATAYGGAPVERFEIVPDR